MVFSNPGRYYRMVSDRPPFVTVALVSGSALAYEILLMRLLAVVQWHHFAFLVISLALLGYGASGSWIALFPRASREGYDTFFHLSAAGFVVSLWCSTRAAVYVPFNALEIFWSPIQWVLITLVTLFLSIPFFFGGTLVGLTLRRFDRQIPGIYAADLFGAGSGSLAIVGLLFCLNPMEAVTAVVGLAAVATATGRMERPSRVGTYTAATAIAGFGLVLAVSGEDLLRRITPYKPLPQVLEVPDTRVVAERSSPMGWIAVAESPTVPFRLVPGASLLSTEEPPDQLAVFTDGDRPEAITRFAGDPGELAFLDQTTGALAFHLEPSFRRVLLPMAGTGTTALLARYHKSAQIDALELDTRKIELVRETFASFSGWRFLGETTRYHPEEIRGFLAKTSADYDLILFPPMGTGTSPGALALTSDYGLTREALQLCIQKLAPGGCLSLSWWVRLPPRDGLRLVDTVAAALRAEGERDPAKSIAVIRSWKTGTLLVRKGGLAREDIPAIRRFCRERAFDPVFFPGIGTDEVNRRTVLRSPMFYTGVSAILEPEREDFLRRYKFAVKAVGDDRPFFYFFYKWNLFSELTAMGRQGRAVLLEWGYPVLVLAVGIAVLLSAVLILLPLAFTERSFRSFRGGGWRAVVYFAGIGAGFISIEMIYIQMGIRYLHHPAIAAASVLTGFLVFAGLGSKTTAWLSRASLPGPRPEIWAVGGIVAAAAVGFGVATFVFDRLSSVALGFRIVFVVLSVAPVAFFMGMPFPLGLSRLSRRRPDWIPWAWGINGCASVTGAVLAMLLILHLGFSRVMLVAVSLYVVAALAGPVPERNASLIRR